MINAGNEDADVFCKRGRIKTVDDDTKSKEFGPPIKATIKTLTNNNHQGIVLKCNPGVLLECARFVKVSNV